MKRCYECPREIGRANTSGLCRTCYHRLYARSRRGYRREYQKLDGSQRVRVIEELRTESIAEVCRYWLISRSLAYKLRAAAI